MFFIAKLRNHQSNWQSDSSYIKLLYNFHPTWQLSLVSLSIILNILFELLRKVTRNHNDWHYWNISCNKFHQEKMRKRNHRKVISTNIYREMKNTELEYKTFDQEIENLLLSGTIFTVWPRLFLYLEWRCYYCILNPHLKANPNVS